MPVSTTLPNHTKHHLSITNHRGYNYIMVAYNHDSNTIHAEPMKNRSGQEIIKGYTTTHNLLSERGIAPKMNYLDNECPKVLKQFMTEKEGLFQLGPPHLHRRNLAERSIQMFKNHFIVGLSRVKKLPNPPLVPVSTTLPNHTKHHLSITNQPKNLCLHSTTRRLRF